MLSIVRRSDIRSSGTVRLLASGHAVRIQCCWSGSFCGILMSKRGALVQGSKETGIVEMSSNAEAPKRATAAQLAQRKYVPAFHRNFLGIPLCTQNPARYSGFLVLLQVISFCCHRLLFTVFKLLAFLSMACAVCQVSSRRKIAGLCFCVGCRSYAKALYKRSVR